MKTAGIDVGFDTIKIVIMDGDKVLAKATGASGCAARVKAIENLYAEALASAGLKAEDIENVVASGVGKYDVKFASDRITDAMAGAKAAKYFMPEAKAVVDVGADQTRVVTLNDEGKAVEIVLNQKCMAGLGLALDDYSYRMGFTLDEISAFPAGADKGTFVNDGCRVFAELDALEELNNGTPKDQVMGAIINTVIVRLNSILHDKVMPGKDTTVMIGGVTKNAAVVNGLKARSGVDFKVPEDAIYGAAIGCALTAATGLA